MMTADSIYESLMENLLNTLREIDALDKEAIKKRLASITDNAELMHDYLYFRERNKTLTADGKPTERLEDVFDPEVLPAIQFLIKHDDLW